MNNMGDFQQMGPIEFCKGGMPWFSRPEETPTTSEPEQEHLQNLKCVWLQFIGARITSYDTVSIKQRIPALPLVDEIRSNSGVGRASNRVFGIAELLEMILCHADSTARLIALSVCREWKDVALRIMLIPVRRPNLVIEFPNSSTSYPHRPKS
ncbi:hypothetical protein BU23DRAFT_270438 [Bimuria novae-zelandiae CBS 107.79]|uniref:F-box domain-containing protein n=1 Tax=Bimuria novae-zelandiae CBS 107.79 TaxID=1447943 RepID=A0A6A5UUQ1_9PLEO|nr:hypothetical protein BU23DRAFT_270438 [Bimuria novae-zelandiae CBS 107.79]